MTKEEFLKDSIEKEPQYNASFFGNTKHVARLSSKIPRELGLHVGKKGHAETIYIRGSVARGEDIIEEAGIDYYLPYAADEEAAKVMVGKYGVPDEIMNSLVKGMSEINPTIQKIEGAEPILQKGYINVKTPFILDTDMINWNPAKIFGGFDPVGLKNLDAQVDTLVEALEAQAKIPPARAKVIIDKLAEDMDSLIAKKNLRGGEDILVDMYEHSMNVLTRKAMQDLGFDSIKYNNLGELARVSEKQAGGHSYILFRDDQFVTDFKQPVSLPPASASQKTQLGSSTIPSYKKAREVLGEEGKTLDFGAGRGQGAAEINADTYEPYPREDFNPTFSKASDIPDSSYENLTSLNVLNVMPREARDQAVADIGRVLSPNGRAVVTTRGKDVMSAKGQLGPEPMSIITTADTYQKGFTQPELRNYLQDQLGDSFTVKNLPQKIGQAGVLIKKLPSLGTGKVVNNREVFKNLRGTSFQRGNNTYPVGKVVGNQVYFHKQYIDEMPDNVQELYTKAIKELPEDFSFNTLMYEKGVKGKPNRIRFDEAPNFNSAREPVPGNTFAYAEDGVTKRGNSNSIWHHKWMWVDDNYKNFNVDESYTWSREWTGTLKDTNYQKIGKEDVWQEELTKYNLFSTGGRVLRSLGRTRRTEGGKILGSLHRNCA